MNLLYVHSYYLSTLEPVTPVNGSLGYWVTGLLGHSTLVAALQLLAQLVKRSRPRLTAVTGPWSPPSHPNLVSVASEFTKGSGVAVASVAGAFPSGLSSLKVRLSDIAEAVGAGADEVDVVLTNGAEAPMHLFELFTSRV